VPPDRTLPAKRSWTAAAPSEFRIIVVIHVDPQVVEGAEVEVLVDGLVPQAAVEVDVAVEDVALEHPLVADDRVEHRVVKEVAPPAMPA